MVLFSFRLCLRVGGYCLAREDTVWLSQWRGEEFLVCCRGVVPYVSCFAVSGRGWYAATCCVVWLVGELLRFLYGAFFFYFL